jgi:D-tyrosyl-tRNA(Tyr) deacylase
VRAVIQRVRRASVSVSGEVVGAIDRGLVALVGVAPDDAGAEVNALADKLAGLRIFADADGRMNRSVGDIGGAVLVISQFTLLADVRRGRRPSFAGAADPGHAEPLVAALVARLASLGVTVEEGRFGAAMSVSLVNEGPVTLILEVVDGRVV